MPTPAPTATPETTTDMWTRRALTLFMVIVAIVFLTATIAVSEVVTHPTEPATPHSLLSPDNPEQP